MSSTAVWVGVGVIALIIAITLIIVAVVLRNRNKSWTSGAIAALVFGIIFGLISFIAFIGAVWSYNYYLDTVYDPYSNGYVTPSSLRERCSNLALNELQNRVANYPVYNKHCGGDILADKMNKVAQFQAMAATRGRTIYG